MTASPTSWMFDEIRRAALLPQGADLSDGQLLDCFLARRDAAAFEALVRRHGPMVLGVCRRVLRDHHDAEDAFQATFLVFIRKAAGIRPRDKLANWLYGVAYRAALKARAMNLRRRARERKMAMMRQRDAVQPDQCAGDWQPLLDQELSRLPDKYRTALVLCGLEGKTGKEAARQLGWPEGTVSSRLARARALLAKRLARHGVILPAGSLAAVLAEEPVSAAEWTQLVITTVKAASLPAAGSASSFVLSTEVAALTQGVVRAMFLSKLTKIAAVMLLTALLATGTGLVLTTSLAAGDRREKGAASAPSEPTDHDQRRNPPRESLRYDGKTFEEWHNLWRFELKPAIHVEAIKALSAFGAKGYGKEAATDLLEIMKQYYRAFDQDEQKVGAAVSSGLLRIGPPAVPVLVEELKKGDVDDRKFAAQELGQLGVLAKPAVPQLVLAMKDKDAGVRSNALDAVRLLDGKSERFRKLLIAALKDESPQVQSLAAARLGEFGPDAADAVPALLQLLPTEDSDVKFSTANALVAIAPNQKAVIAGLLPFLGKGDERIGQHALIVLDRIGPEAKNAVPELIQAFKKYPRHRIAIAQALGNIGPAAREAIPVLKEALLEAAPAEPGGGGGVPGTPVPANVLFRQALQKIQG